MNDNIINELIAINNSKYTGNELFFDPVSGELKVVKKKENNPDWMTLDQLCEDGFL